MLARQYPELSHYLAAFLVPYWDLDSGYTPVELLGKLVEEFGWRRELIHAYLHCDGEQSRRCFFQTAEGDPVNPSLLEHFSEHADDYAWFKAQLLKRLEQTPLLAYADEQTLEETQPILEFFYSLDDWPVEAELEDTELWRDQVKKQLILGHRVEDEALALQDALGVEPKAQVAEAWLMDDRLAPWQQDKTDTGNAQAEQESGKSSGQTQGDSQLPSLEELPFSCLAIPASKVTSHSWMQPLPIVCRRHWTSCRPTWERCLCRLPARPPRVHSGRNPGSAWLAGAAFPHCLYACLQSAWWQLQ